MAGKEKDLRHVKDAVKIFSAFAAHEHPETWGRFCDNSNLLTKEAVWECSWVGFCSTHDDYLFEQRKNAATGCRKVTS